MEAGLGCCTESPNRMSLVAPAVPGIGPLAFAFVLPALAIVTMLAIATIALVLPSSGMPGPRQPSWA